MDWLDASNTARREAVVISTRTVDTEYDNPNLRSIEEVTSVLFNGDTVYEPPFGLCGLAQDETAMAIMMQQASLYGKGLAGSPYPLQEALQDAYTMLLMQKACETGEKVCTERQPWN